MAMLHRLCAEDEELLLATIHRVVELENDDSRAGGVAWWEDLTSQGGEGMVIKPLDFAARGRKGPKRRRDHQHGRR